MRRVYRAPGRGRDPHLRAPGRGGRRQTRDDHRGAVAQPEPRGAEGVDRRGRAAVRLLSIGPDHGRGGTAGEKPPPERRGHRRGDDEHLPLRDLSADPLRHSPRRAGGVTMSARTDVTRREFLETAGAAGAGLVVSFHLPLGPRFRPTTADPFAPNAWIRINPDDSVLIVVDRSEMGQGVTTSLPMLLAEELEADWSKIKIEFAPADKAYINPMFGMQGTGGSTSVRAAVIARSPVFGGKVASFDATKAKAVPGVRHVVQVSSGVAVVADGYWPAKKGRDALAVTWDEGANATVSSASIAQLFAQRAQQAGAVARHDGDAAGTLASSASKVAAAYDLPFLAHATMEPMNCTAHVRSDGVDVWAPTQFQTGAQGLGAKIGGVTPDKVKVHTTYLGGGFGRRFELDFIQEALETSKAAGAAVKVIWSREDDIRNAQYRPVNHHRLQAGLDASGMPVVWTHRIVAPSIMARVFPDTIKNGLDEEAVEGGVGMPYTIPNVHVDYQLTDTGIPVGFWRSGNNSYNAFAVESFIDELAHAAKQDPYEYRRDLLGKAPRHLGALTLAASKAGG